MLPGSAASQDGGGMHSPPILAPQATGAALHRAQWERTVAGYVVDVIEPIGMLALIGLALGCWQRSRRKRFLAFACIALALTAARRLNNAIVAWTDLQALTTYASLASVMWVPTMVAWALAWNRWCIRSWRSIDVLAVVLGVVGLVGVLIHSPSWTSAARLGAIVLFAIIAVRLIRGGPPRVLALSTLALVVTGLFGGELLDPIGVPGIWFPFGIGVSRTQYLYAIGLPLMAFLVARNLPPMATSSMAPEGHKQDT